MFGASVDAEAGPSAAERLFSATLNYPPEHFDAILIWDKLELLPGSLLPQVVERLRQVLRPDGALFACFHSDSQNEVVDRYSFRILDRGTVAMIPRGRARAGPPHNNRSLERVFEKFRSLKFFLTRDAFREVIARK